MQEAVQKALKQVAHTNTVTPGQDTPDLSCSRVDSERADERGRYDNGGGCSVWRGRTSAAHAAAPHAEASCEHGLLRELKRERERD